MEGSGHFTWITLLWSLTGSKGRKGPPGINTDKQLFRHWYVFVANCSVSFTFLRAGRELFRYIPYLPIIPITHRNDTQVHLQFFFVIRAQVTTNVFFNKIDIRTFMKFCQFYQSFTCIY